MQRLLGIDADGVFGPVTERAVRSWQREHNISVDGVVGPVTLAILGFSRPATPAVTPATGFGMCGQQWSVPEYLPWLAEQPRAQWAHGITMHHTASPSLAQRPVGLSAQHIANMRDYYIREKEWSTGPHLFVDDRMVSGLTPLSLPGTHARSYNGTHIGVEVLGDYDSESPTEGRGAVCWWHAALVVAGLVQWLQIDVERVNFHRDDPRTAKSCPGRLVTREWFLGLVREV